ncbi:MAG: hypothetical protein AAGI07_16930 [Bacteroidota bacterium]
MSKIHRFSTSIFIGLLLLFSGCEEKAFNFVLNIDNAYEFAVFDDGVFSVGETIDKDELLEDIEIESDAEIEAVNIESIAVKITELDGNAANSVQMDGLLYLDGDLSSSPIVVFNDLVIDENTASEFIAITTLNAAGVNALADKFLAYVENTDSEEFIFNVSGSSIPEDSRIEANVELKIRATVKFKENLEVPFFVGDDE